MNNELTIIIDGIKVYENYFCHCGCGKNIPVKEYHKRWKNYVPDFINGHIRKTQFKKGNHPLTEFKSGGDNPIYIDGYAHERQSAKWRGLGFVPLNERNEIANSPHHIDEELVVFIPRKIHESFNHSVRKGYNLEEMNNLAFKWLDIELRGINMQNTLQSFSMEI